MIERVISGGQSGADQAGWRAAKSAGIPTGGWMPKGFLTEDGMRPEFVGLYGAKEHASTMYPPRTEANVVDASLTLWFGFSKSAGYWCTRKSAEKHFKAFWEVGVPCNLMPADKLMRQLSMCQYTVVNVAGNRESTNPGIGAWVESYLTEVFRLVAAGGPL